VNSIVLSKLHSTKRDNKKEGEIIFKKKIANIFFYN